MTFHKVSVLVPTRQRLEQLQAMRESFDRTTDGRAELVFRVDADDIETLELLAAERLVVGPRLEGYRSLPAFYNELVPVATGDVFLCGNDDMLFQTPGWPSLVLEAANRYPDGLFNFGVATYNADHYPFSIVSRALTERLGFLWDERIFWGDIFLRDVLAALGRCEMLPQVEIRHDWSGDEASQNEIYRRDPTYWTGTHARAVADAVARLQRAA